jgi:UPF0176 protein
MKYQVLLFYKYVTIEDPHGYVETFRALCERHALLGRVLIAEEGINATLEGSMEATEVFIKEWKEDSRFGDVEIKRSEGTGKSFRKLSVKWRNEIVGTKFPKEVDPRVKTAPHLSPDELHALYENEEDFLVVDMRNSYEYASGHFANSFDPGLNASRELPEKLEKLRVHQDKKIVTVCTGGIRCEKMSAYLLHAGFDNVYQLDGGMHTYMEKYPEGHFKGTLFTFDDRMTMDFGGNREIVGRCKLCDCSTESYQNCSNAECNMLFLVCEECTGDAGPIFCTEECKARAVHIIDRVRR